MTLATSPDTKKDILANTIEAWTVFAKLDFLTHESREGVSKVRAAGVEPLARLLVVARRDTGQSQVIARFLLNLYNGNRFPFDMTDFRRLDHDVFIDCMSVLQMDYMPSQEVHMYFKRGSEIWERLGTDWGFRDFQGESWR